MIAKLERTYNNVQQNMKQTREQNSATNQQQQNHRLKRTNPTFFGMEKQYSENVSIDAIDNNIWLIN